MCYVEGMQTWRKTVKMYLGNKKVSHQDFSAMVGVTRETLSRWLNDESIQPKHENIQKIAEALSKITNDQNFDVGKFVEDVYRIESLGEIPPLEGEEEVQPLPLPDPQEFIYIPKVEPVLSSGNATWTTDARVKGYYAFRIEWIKQRGPVSSMVLMEVQGESMFPTIRDGDRVLINRSESRPLDGKIMAVGLGESIVIKRISIKPDSYILLSDNSDQERHSPIVVHKKDLDSQQIRFLGKVIWLGREL